MSDVTMTAEQFGIAMAKAIQERPYSGNWALAHLAVHIATGDEDKADAVYADMTDFLKMIVAQERKPAGGELLPCPFCGGEAGVHRDDEHPDCFHVRCDTDRCPANVDEVFGWAWSMTRGEAIAAWNRRSRPAPPAPSKSVAKRLALQRGESVRPEAAGEQTVALLREARDHIAWIDAGNFDRRATWTVLDKLDAALREDQGRG